MPPAVPRPLVMIVPGLGVTRYLRTCASALADAGCDVRLLPGPGSRGVPADVVTYGAAVAARALDILPTQPDGGLEEKAAMRPHARRRVVLVGHSVGAQVAAEAARQLACPGVDPDLDVDLVMAGPTFDARFRSLAGAAVVFALLTVRSRLDVLLLLVPDWLRSGPVRLLRTTLSAWARPLADTVAQLPPAARLTVVHGERDALASRRWCRALAAAGDGTVIELTGRDHTWPWAHADELVELCLGAARGEAGGEVPPFVSCPRRAG